MGLRVDRVSELLKRSDLENVTHLDIVSLDAEPTKLFSLLPNLRALDVSYLGFGDTDLRSLLQSVAFKRLRWLNLAGNPITLVGVQALCATHNKLFWLELRGTFCNATPYLDDENEETSLWRIPKITHELIKAYGLQKWMVLGPLADENEKYISREKFMRRKRFYRSWIKFYKSRPITDELDLK